MGTAEPEPRFQVGSIEAEALVHRGLERAFPDDDADDYKVLCRLCVRLFVINESEDGWKVSGDGIIALVNNTHDESTTFLFMVDREGNPGFCVKVSPLLQYKKDDSDPTFHLFKLRGQYAGLSFMDNVESAQFGNVLFFALHRPSSHPTHPGVGGTVSPNSPNIRNSRRLICRAVSNRPAPPAVPDPSPAASAAPADRDIGRRNTVAGASMGSAAAARARMQARKLAAKTSEEVPAASGRRAGPREGPPLPPPPSTIHEDEELPGETQSAPGSSTRPKRGKGPPLPPPPSVTGLPGSPLGSRRRPPASQVPTSPLSRSHSQSTTPSPLRKSAGSPKGYSDADSGCGLSDKDEDEHVPQFRRRAVSMSVPRHSR